MEEKENNILSQFNGEIVEMRIQNVNGKTEIHKYKKGDILGKGGFGICYKCICIETKKIYALKELKLEENRKVSEYKIHKDLDHKNIVKLIEYYDNKKILYLLLEYCENKGLSSILKKRKKLKEIEVQYYITNLIKAIKYLHEQRVVHRDIKPSNIFLTDILKVKLGDFGISTNISPGGYIYGKVGTPDYMAPEIIAGKGYSFEVDIWAIGIIIYQLILGELPFHDRDKNNQKNKIINIEYGFPIKAIISDAAKDLIEKILVKDPKQRPTLNQILQHDFFKLGRSIPKLLPTVFKDKEPSINYIKNFMPDADDNGVVNRRFISKNIIDIRIE